MYYVLTYAYIQYCHKDKNEEITVVPHMKKSQVAEKHWFKGNFYYHFIVCECLSHVNDYLFKNILNLKF